jgi:hypothetical protein
MSTLTFNWGLGCPSFELWEYGRLQVRLDFSELVDRPLILPKHAIERQSDDFTTESGLLVSHVAGVRVGWSIGFRNCRALQVNALDAWRQLLNFMIASTGSDPTTREIRFYPHGGRGTYYLVQVLGDFEPTPWQEVYAILEGTIELVGAVRLSALPPGV